MIRSLALLASSLVLMTCAAVAQETPPVSQVFACNFNDGMGVEDLEEATAFFNATIQELGSADLTESRSYLWVPYVVSNVPYDFLWFSSYDNLNQLARAHEAINGSEAGQQSMANFAAVADCDSGLIVNETIYDGEGDPVSDNEALLESYSCTLRAGKSVDDARAVVAEWAALVGGLETTGGLSAFLRTPLIANTPFDLSYLLVHDSMTQYAARQTNYMSSGGSALTAKFDAVHSCESSLWTGSQVVPPYEEGG